MNSSLQHPQQTLHRGSIQVRIIVNLGAVSPRGETDLQKVHGVSIQACLWMSTASINRALHDPETAIVKDFIDRLLEAMACCMGAARRDADGKKLTLSRRSWVQTDHAPQSYRRSGSRERDPSMSGLNGCKTSLKDKRHRISHVEWKGVGGGAC
jgi:hypothetical protein